MAAAERRLAGCRLLRSLGKGGLGEVFEAVAPDGRTVAIKAFRVREDERGLLAAAFVRESHLGQRLQHPDIVRVLDSGCDGDHAYLLMEYVPGLDLRHHTRPGHLLPLPRVLNTVERVARALAAAHALNVVHRDIKPGNVLVDDSGAIVKLTDFGLARLGDAFRSRTGTIAGTPSYMAPEQLAEGPVGPATDLYALGVLLFELLSGRLPHEERSFGALLRSVAHQPAPRLASLRPDLPPALDTLVAELLEKNPSARPPSAWAVAERLAGLQQASADAGGEFGAGASGPKSRG